MTHAHFAYGWISPIMGFGFALAGAYLGLICAARARSLPPGPPRLRQLAFAALSIGGVGVWMMHFTSRIGFSVDPGEVRYGVGLTSASFVVAVAALGVGLYVIGSGEPSIPRLVLAGPLTGMGITVMHYTGMAGVNLSGTIRYDAFWVVASMAVAVVAATAALYCTTWVEDGRALFVASASIAAGMCGVHYTGMAAVSVAPGPVDAGPVPGAHPLVLLIPIAVLAAIALIGIIVVVLAESDDDLDDAEVEAPRPPTLKALPSAATDLRLLHGRRTTPPRPWPAIEAAPELKLTRPAAAAAARESMPRTGDGESRSVVETMPAPRHGGNRATAELRRIRDVKPVKTWQDLNSDDEPRPSLPSRVDSWR
ncbi:MAG: MHYT domain-containing protein [Stackebrandtia sp.]